MKGEWCIYKKDVFCQENFCEVCEIKRRADEYKEYLSKVYAR